MLTYLKDLLETIKELNGQFNLFKANMKDFHEFLKEEMKR